MLSIGKITAGPAAAAYYLDQVAQGREDYYAGEGEEGGRWVGAGARLLEWSGEVDGEDFTSMLAGAGLRKPRANGVAGFDLTFRAPKSVSVLWGIAPEDVVRELRAGHDAAVAEALGYLEREACRGRRGKDGVVQVRGEGFVGAAFVHRASRAGDPLLHTHVVVGNLTRGPDGRWTALDGRHLYRQAKTVGYLYQAVLRRELTERLGLEWNPVEQGVADVRGMPRAVVEHFSQRRAEILEHMVAHGGRSPASAQIAALETRRAKHDVPIDRLRLDWAARATEHCLTPGMVDELLGHDEVREARVPARLPEDLTECVSTFGRAELLQALAQGQSTGARVDELENLAARVLADPEIVALPDGKARAGVLEPRFTTREMLATEAELIACARRRQRERVARVPGYVLHEQLRDHATLSDEQRAVVRGLCGSGDGVAVVRAAAGTGKTFTLDAAREAWQASGHQVVGCALSARAALELEDSAGIPSVTIAAAKRSLAEGRELPHDGVLVVDEAGMVGTRDLALLADAAEAGNTKLVLVGDDRQLPEIDAGGAFHSLAEEVDALELTEVRRQHHAWDRDALDALRNGDVERWARAYRDHGMITVADNALDARAALVNDWSRAPGEAIMIAARRTDVADLNDRASELLKEQGRLSRHELDIGERALAEGDRVIGLRNDRDLGILNGQRGTVRNVDRDRCALTVELDGGRDVTLDSTYLCDGHLDHGYAMTAHKAQGATVDRTFVLGSQDLYRELGYTALSRHREEARFYVARGDLEPNVEPDLPDYDLVVLGLEGLLKRSAAKQLALDSLTDRDICDLKGEREELRKIFEGHELPSGAELIHLGWERDQAQEILDRAERHVDGLQDLRDQTGLLQFRERARLDDLLSGARELRDHHRERFELATAAHDVAEGQFDDWLGKYGDQAARLVATGHQLAERQQLEEIAMARQEAVARTPDWPMRELPAPELAHDLEIDLDFGP